MEGIVSRIGALDADDSAVLRWWINCSKSFPVRLYLDVSNCMLGVYLEPITLAQVLHDAPNESQTYLPPVVVEWVDSKAHSSEVPDAVHENADFAVEDDSSDDSLDTSVVSDGPVESPGVGMSPALRESVEECATAELLQVVDPTEQSLGLVSEITTSSEATTPPIITATDEPTLSTAESTGPAATSTPFVTEAAEPVEPSALAEVGNRPLNPEAPNAWRHWMQKLDAARGPKPLNAIEQLFINAYVPLADAYHRGIADSDARAVLEQWSTSFARSYSEAFDAIRLRGRRPMMVLDIPEAAQRLARLHGARNVQLVLVDGMRFDLGVRVENHLVAALGQQATLTDRFLLWSALPTTTSQQLELIGRGPDGLKDGDIHSETPILVARGRQASTLRRVRAGNREILKLDLVEARLGEPGAAVAPRLDQLAIELSEALASAFTKMAPRTLVAVFGDHGFCLEPTEFGSSAMHQGNASPEEVLVPGFAWLVGQTH
jgi:hypothetical protein